MNENDEKWTPRYISHKSEINYNTYPSVSKFQLNQTKTVTPEVMKDCQLESAQDLKIDLEFSNYSDSKSQLSWLQIISPLNAYYYFCSNVMKIRTENYREE